MSKGHMEALAALKGRRYVTSGTLPPRPAPGSKCPSCGCKVPKRQSAAARQRASRDRKKAKT